MAGAAVAECEPTVTPLPSGPHLVRRKADLCAADKLVRLDDLERHERRDSLPPKLTYKHTVSFASAEVTFRAVTVSFAS